MLQRQLESMDNKKNFQAFKKTCLSESVALSAISHNVGPSPAVCAVQVCFFAAIPVPIPMYIYIYTYTPRTPGSPSAGKQIFVRSAKVL